MPSQGVGGLRVHFETEGAGAQSVLFVHGLRNSAESWRPVRDRIDQSALTAWSLDLPGCGRSEAPTSWERCTIDSYAHTVEEFCGARGLADVVVVGHSLGGAIAIRLALQHPKLLRGLVLVAPASTRGFDFVPDGA